MNKVISFFRDKFFNCICLIIVLLASYVIIEAKNTDINYKFGHFSVVDPAITLKKYKPLLDILSKEIGIRVILVQKTNYSKLNEAFIQKEIDIGILNAFSYVQIANKAELIPLARRVIGDRGFYQSYIIVRKDSEIKTYKDLEGQIFAFSDPHSTTGYLLPHAMLIKNGIEPDKVLKKVLFVGKQDSTIYAVLNRTADAGAVASYIFDGANKEIKKHLVILGRSKPIPLGPVVIRKDLGDNTIRKIKALFLNLHLSEEGLTALKAAGLKRFEKAEAQDYNVIKKMADLTSTE